MGAVVGNYLKIIAVKIKARACRLEQGEFILAAVGYFRASCNNVGVLKNGVYQLNFRAVYFVFK